jgi:hypothetical protein
MRWCNRHEEKLRKKERHRDKKLIHRYTNYLQEMRIESENLVGNFNSPFSQKSQLSPENLTNAL